MRRRIYLGGSQPLDVETDSPLGIGGQAVVVLHQNQAIKLLRQPNPRFGDKVRFLISQNFHLSPRVLLPTNYVTDRPQGSIVGLCMPLLPQGFREFSVLFNRGLRKKLNFQTPLVLDLFLDAHAQLSSIHHAGFVVGDLSGRNVAFVADPSPQTFWYDTDSYQIGRFPSEVWTWYFVDPLQYPRLDRNLAPDYHRENDWFSFSVLLAWALLLDHPFGIDPDIDRFKQNVTSGQWLANKKQLSSLALRPETVSDPLLDFLEATFIRNQRLEFPLHLIEDMRRQIVQCTSCDTWYSAQRPHCPQCSATSPVPPSVSTLIRLANLVTTGQILTVKFFDKQLFVVARRQNHTVVSIKNASDPVVEHVLPEFPSSTRFEVINQHLLAINRPGSNDIELWSLVGTPRIVYRTTSAFFSGNRQTVFRASSGKLLRTATRQILSGDFINDELIERPLPIQISNDQTWFWADPQRDTVLGFYHVFDLTQYWLIASGNRFEIDIPQLELGESLLDQVVRFGAKSVFVRRLTQKRGRRYIRTELVDLQGRVTLSRVQDAGHFPLVSIHGVAYNDGQLFHPTDQGIVKEDILADTFSALDHTAKAVSATDSLYHLGGGQHFLVVRDTSVDYLVLP